MYYLQAYNAEKGRETRENAIQIYKKIILGIYALLINRRLFII